MGTLPSAAFLKEKAQAKQDRTMADASHSEEGKNIGKFASDEALSLSDAISSDLMQYLSSETCGVDEDSLVSALLSGAVEALLGRELDSASVLLATNLLSEAPASEARQVAREIARDSQSFVALGEAVRKCAADLPPEDTVGNGNKEQRSEAVGSRGAIKSYSLFDMIDRESIVERITADDILRSHGEGGPEHDSDVNWDCVADLLDRVEDMEDIVSNPFSGDVWGKIQEVLRSGLSSTSSSRYVDMHSKLRSMCEKSPNPAEYAQQRCDLTMNILDFLSEIITLSSHCRISEGLVYLSELVGAVVCAWHDLVMGLASVVEYLADEDLDKIIEGIMSLFIVKPQQRTRYAVQPYHLLASYDPYAAWFETLCCELQPIRILGAANRVGLVNATLDICHSHGGDLAFALVGEQVKNSVTLESCQGNFFGSMGDIEEATYVQSLSLLRTFVVTTDGYPGLFHHCIDKSNSIQKPHGKYIPSKITSEGVLYLLSPFQNVLAASVSEVGFTIDKDLVYLCGEAAEAIIVGQMQDWGIFVTVFMEFVSAVCDGILNEDFGVHPFHPTTTIFIRVCRKILDHYPWLEATREWGDGNTSPLESRDLKRSAFVSTLNILIETVHKIFTSATYFKRETNMSSLRETFKVLQPIFRSCSLMKLCHRENLLSSVKAFHTIGKETDQYSDMMSSLLSLSTSFEGLNALKELGLIYECVTYTTSSIFLSRNTLDEAEMSQLTCQVMHLVSTRDGCQTFIESEAFQTACSYISLFSNKFDSMEGGAGVIENVQDLILSIFSGIFMSCEMEKPSEEVRKFMRNVIPSNKDSYFIQSLRKMASKSVDYQALVHHRNQQELPKKDDCSSDEIFSKYKMKNGLEFVDIKERCESKRREAISSPHASYNGYYNTSSFAQTDSCATTRKMVRTIRSLAHCDAPKVCNSLKFLTEPNEGTINSLHFIGSQYLCEPRVRSDGFHLESNQNLSQKLDDGDDFTASTTSYIKFIFESNNIAISAFDESDAWEILSSAQASPIGSLSVNCFAMISLALCNGEITKTRAFLQTLEQCPGSRFLHGGNMKCSAMLIRLVNEILEVECPEILSALDEAGIPLTPTLSLWLKQSFVGVLSFADSILVNAIALGMGLDYLVYYIIAMLRHLQEGIFDLHGASSQEGMKRNHRMKLAVFSNDNFASFRAIHALDYTQGLCRSHRERCVSSIIKVLNS